MAIPSVLIIGAGNFGAATALSLLKKGNVKVTIVDTAHYPNPRAASHDINKIVRDDYPDRLYMRLLKKAMPLWREDDLYKTFYHEVGMLRADSTSFGEESINSYRDMGIPNKSELLPVDEVRRRWNGAFETADFKGVDKVLWNPDVGFAEADKALGAIVQAAVDLGAEYIVGEVTTIEFGPEDQCTGVALKDGTTLHADKILLAAGARTASLLAQSAPEKPLLHAGERLLATGAVSFYAKLHGAQKDKFSTIPVLKNCLPQVKGTLPSTRPDTVGTQLTAHVQARACRYSRMELSSSTATYALPTTRYSRRPVRPCQWCQTSPCTTRGRDLVSSSSLRIGRDGHLMVSMVRKLRTSRLRPTGCVGKQGHPL
jgi:sarcosine oxidase/L-pipecolate oxidase